MIHTKGSIITVNIILDFKIRKEHFSTFLAKDNIIDLWLIWRLCLSGKYIVFHVEMSLKTCFTLSHETQYAQAREMRGSWWMQAQSQTCGSASQWQQGLGSKTSAAPQLWTNRTQQLVCSWIYLFKIEVWFIGKKGHLPSPGYAEKIC